LPTSQASSRRKRPQRAKKAPEVETGPEALSLLNGLISAAPPPLYSRTDRYRDFRAVLLNGESDELRSQRVLYLILERLGLMRSPVKGDEGTADPLRTFHALGQQDFARWLLSVLMTEPIERPEKTISEKPER
jgi:hypothetical protein